MDSHHAHPILPFQIDIDPAQVTELQSRLANTRLPHPLPDDAWNTGVPITTLRDYAERWRNHDWAATQDRLNQLPQFTTEIDGQTIHFLHIRSQAPNSIPLMLLHGWPGSFLEFERLIKPLTDPAAHGAPSDDAFDLIIPSLPGFGFSTPLVDGDWSTHRIATTFTELMTRLGYDRFAVQGGDLGASVAPEIGRVVPSRVIGVHVNGALGAFQPEVDDQTLARMSALEQDRMRRIGEFMQTEFGYIALQSTRPGLLGAMLADSPIAQFAWILDKLQAWSHPAEAPAEELLGEDFIFANASLYWFTASAGSAAYVGYAQEQPWGAIPESSGVPTAAIQFAHDIGIRSFAEQGNSIVRWTEHPSSGGHFAALEEPELLLRDIREFFRPWQ